MTAALRTLRLVFLLVAGAALPRLAAADDNHIIFPAGTPRATAPAVATGSGINTITLVLAIAMAGVGGWFVWRNRRMTVGGRDLRALSIDETRSLGNRQYLVVASYEGKKFLLGVCPGRIDMLSSLARRECEDRE